MALIAVPFFSMRLGSSDAGSDPSGSTTRQAHDVLARGFGPGYNGPLQLVAEVSGSAQDAAFSRVLTAAVARSPGVVRVTPPHLLPGAGGAPAVISADAYPVRSPQSPELVSTAPGATCMC